MKTWKNTGEIEGIFVRFFCCLVVSREKRRRDDIATIKKSGQEIKEQCRERLLLLLSPLSKTRTALFYAFFLHFTFLESWYAGSSISLFYETQKSSSEVCWWVSCSMELCASSQPKQNKNSWHNLTIRISSGGKKGNKLAFYQLEIYHHWAV